MAEHRHKRETNARRKPRAALVAGPIALLATASVVIFGSVVSSPDTELTAEETTPDVSAAPGTTPSRDVVSRSGSRSNAARLDAQRLEAKRRQARLAEQRARAATLRAVRGADTRLWTTTALNLWTSPDADATKVGVLDAGKHVLVTGRKTAERVEVVVDGTSRWVTAGYLSEEKPVPERPEASTPSSPGLSMEPCPDSSVENGLTSDAVYVYRSVCNAFPQITTYGGWDDHGEHASGRALDIMTSDVELGNAIAAFLQQHAAELNLYDIIWRQRIWTPERASEGWRFMPSRGSATADHYDHVHVATNG